MAAMPRFLQVISLGEESSQVNAAVNAPARALLVLWAASLTWIDQTEFVEYGRAYSLERFLLSAFTYAVLRPRLAQGGHPRWSPLPSARFWVRIVLCLFVVALALAWPLKVYLEATRGTPLPSQVRSVGLAYLTWLALILAPVVEEVVYRGAICLALWIALGPWCAVLLSGAAFTYLHVSYGNFAPNHLAAGVILSWAFVKSRQLWLAIVLHGLGNLLVLVGDLLLLQ